MDTEDMWQTEGGVFRPWGLAKRPAILPVRTSRSMCRFRSRKMRENGRQTWFVIPEKRKCPQSGSEKWRRAGGQTGRQYGQILSNRFWKSGKVQYLFLHNLPGKKKMNNAWQYLWVANGSVHESSCSWTNKNIGNLKMMAENRTCLVASRRNKKKRQDYFESSSFSTNPIGIHSKLPCHFFLISIQYIYPSNT